MYKSLLGAIGLFGLLLLLCAINPSTAAAESADPVEERVLVVRAAQVAVTDSVTVSIPLTEETLYAEDLAVQNQLIIEVLPSYSSSVTVALEEEAFSTEILYARPNENVVILATKETNDIQPAIETITGDQPIETIGIEQQIETIVQQNVDISMPDRDMARKNNDSGNYASVLIGNQKNFLIANPHGVGAVPFGAPISAGEIGAGLIPSQWALAQSSANTVGIDLYNKQGNVRSSAATGNKIRIVFFDTSPFTFPVRAGQALYTGTYTGTFVTDFQLPGFDPLTLKVTNITATQPYTYRIKINHAEDHEEITETETLTDISSHGLFAAALAYAVAPNAEIELVQVLDSYGRASTAQLIAALDQLTATLDSTQSIILNLSLGVLRESSPEDKEMRLLEQAISSTLARGVIIVASAGNRLTETATLTMLLPAGYAEVIGVGASNAAGGIACFSKYKKSAGYGVFAPGGDASFGVTSGNCLPARAVQRCKAQVNINILWAIYYRLIGQDMSIAQRYKCSDMLIGLTYDPQTGDYRYGYWMGTSFAAPIVSGLIALELEQGKTRDEIYELLTPTTRSIKRCPAFIDAQFVTTQITCTDSILPR